MALHRPLRSLLFPFRRRRRLEDMLAGSSSEQSHPIINKFDAFPAVGGSVPPSMHETYDPVHAQYLDAGQPYEQPDPWFEGLHVPSTPQIVGQAAHADDDMADEPVQYVDGLMTLELMEQALKEVREAHQSIDGVVDDDAPIDQVATVDDMAGIDFGPGQMSEPADYDACQMTQDMFDQQMEQAMGGQPEPEPEPQQDPQEQMEDMYDQQLEQMLDPFMMPGMGPSPGPG